MTPDDARALADELGTLEVMLRPGQPFTLQAVVPWLGRNQALRHGAAAALRDLADRVDTLTTALAAAEADAATAREAGRDLVRLVEHLGAQHVDPASLTQLQRRMIRARLNRHRDTLGLPRPDYSGGDMVDVFALARNGGRDA